jgi:hypothetical protein
MVVFITAYPWTLPRVYRTQNLLYRQYALFLNIWKVLFKYLDIKRKQNLWDELQQPTSHSIHS